MPNKSCAFYSCKSNSRKDPTLKWTRFVSPYNDLERYKIWFEKLKRPYYNVTRFTYVCEKHFPQGTDLNELTNLELVPEAESNPEECGIKPIKPEPRKKIDKVIVLPKRTRGNQLKVPKLHYKETLEITEPREPTIGELMKLEFKKQISGISTPNSKKSKVEVQKLTLWQCECNKSFYSKQSLLNHIMKIHGQKQVSSDKPFQVHFQEDVIVFKVNLCEKFKWSVKVNQNQFQENFCKVEVIEHLDSCELPTESILSYDSELDDPLRI